MKTNPWIKSIQAFGLLIHLCLMVTLIAVGYFDLLGLEANAQSSAGLLSKLATAQSPTDAVDTLTIRIADETVGAALLLLSVLKTLAVSAAVSFAAHLICFRLSVR